MEARAGGVGSDDRRRGEILDAAFSVLAERGYRGASTREIAVRARASKETLYSWFGDKRGLFEELIRRQAEGVGEALSASLERGAEEPAVVLRAFADVHRTAEDQSSSLREAATMLAVERVAEATLVRGIYP